MCQDINSRIIEIEDDVFGKNESRVYYSRY